MDKAERQRKIIDMLLEKKKVTTNELLDLFDASVETIRRDLNDLSVNGFVKKTYGGAVLASEDNKLSEFLAWNERNVRYSAEKNEIAEAVLGLVPDGSVIATDTGTTLYTLAHKLISKERLTVITSDIRIGQELAQVNSNQVYLIGGVLANAEQHTGGDLARLFLENFSVIDILLMSADGFTLEDGITTANSDVNSMKKVLIKKAEKVIALIDHSKFGHKALFKTCGLGEIDVLVTDNQSPADFIESIKKHGVEVVKAGDFNH